MSISTASVSLVFSLVIYGGSALAASCPNPQVVDLTTTDPVTYPQQIVWEHGADNVFNTRCPLNNASNVSDYSDNPVRPFLVGNINNPTVYWFADNEKGYYASVGLPVSDDVPDILAKMQRGTNPTGPISCSQWLVSQDNGGPTNQNLNYLYGYHNEIWMVVPYTLDGTTIYTLVHDEYHIDPSETADSFGNLVGAVSTNAAQSFSFYTNPTTAYNMPVIVSPYPYVAYPSTPQAGAGKGGMFAQSNIIQWGKYYYILVEQSLTYPYAQNQIPVNSPAHKAGTCIFRTADLSNPRGWRGWKEGAGYAVPLVHAYPSHLPNPADYLCTPILQGTGNSTPDLYRFSWSYNTVLHAFIIIGLDNHFDLNGTEVNAFVYTLGELDPNTGKLIPAFGATTFQEYYLRTINNVANTTEDYPGLLDPQSLTISNTANSATDPYVQPNDRNFQYSASTPYLYYTETIPGASTNNRNVARDVLQVSCN